ncbi:DUF2460 domain-containing protein [Alterisphingorhabdus coralli]|uniref:DUF2460 domain-containing protein n=1 Tax=Alterisphingorhabdus coralli TaxID=3071408 RepID=A0AA97FAU2_9SPHN|nr:DUF2460 domain-containing protein [Parasphingorhabdus sp. SCSIO 66989]WOE75685.1 DUF2460 domain-containing protein [Parasphingorhabdus sp. SCSIO 66989]
MDFWLAEKRNGQQGDVIQRFDPRFWTVNFPRPMMASVVTSAADALTVRTVFYDRNQLAGLIWDSEDRLDHALLAYATDRDYRHTSLSFRWRSSGIKALDAVHGPTLTIEGRDAEGHPRSWYVRLWNYAQGSPSDALITLNFSDLQGGFLLPDEADPVYAGDIDRMFISLVPPDYDPDTASLVAVREGRVDISEIRCSGHRAMLHIGDIMVPQHGLSMATAYDDSLNQTPERLLRSVRQLGYVGPISHYVGMSHYFRLVAESELVDVRDGQSAINTPCRAWHQDLAQRAAAAGHDLIFSLSYELFNRHCPEDWKQRDFEGNPGLTGWDPPSALLSPANDEAMGYLQNVARSFVAIQQSAGLPVRFQVGEPWWWVGFDHRICLYDDAANAAFGSLSVEISDVRQPMSAAQNALLDAAGAVLAQSTAALADAVRDMAGNAGAELSILIYLPTIADPDSPEVLRANIPLGWARPAFDILQLEDYDWATERRTGTRERALALVADRLGYPLDEQHYFSGFVLNPEDKAQWHGIIDAAEDARKRQIPTIFLWALPQVARDGLVVFDLAGDDAVQAFDDVAFPLPVSMEMLAEAEFSTQILTTGDGHERRNSRWSDARMHYDVGPSVASEADLAVLMRFFRARSGPARGFRFRDPFDHSSADNGQAVKPSDQWIATGNGEQSDFPLLRAYGDAQGGDPQLRRITRPVADTIRIAMDGAETSGWSLQPGGIIRFTTPPPANSQISAGYLFDVPVRFAEDRLAVSAITFAAGEAASVRLIELREDVGEALPAQQGVAA